MHGRLAVFKDEIPEVTAASVQRVIDAGGIIHARSATPEFCCAAITESRLRGITRNPWNTAFSPGGSSGGSGAALVAGMATLATGSDIGGSIRIPASFCGVVGFNPPDRRVPQMPPFNHDHYCHEGPMARTVGDCRLLDNVMAGPHPEDTAPAAPQAHHPRRAAARRRQGDRLQRPPGRLRRRRRGRGRGARDAPPRRSAVSARRVDQVELGWSLDAMREGARAHLAAIFGSWIGTVVEEHRDLLTSYALAFADDLATSTVGDAVRNPGAIRLTKQL